MQRAQPDTTLKISKQTKHWLVWGIILVAAFLRFVRIWTLPPAGGYDPAWYGVDALHILDGEFPVFLPTNIGREVLFSYIVALAVAVFGIGPPAIHIASAAVGLGTIPATYWVAEELFADTEGALCRYGGLFAAAMMAVSYWHVNWSRYGVRAITVPLFVALTMATLLRAMRSSSNRWLVASGVFLGLSLYTYQSARVLPALVVITVGFFAWTHKGSLSQSLRKLAVVFVVALLIFAPMGYYFLTQPDDGMKRIKEVFLFDPALGWRANVDRLRHEVVDALEVYFVHGDEEPIHNLAGRPAMNPFLAGLFILGLVISLRYIWKPPFFILLAWIPLMSMTVILSLGGQPTKRALGALPAIAMLVAVGALVPWSLLDQWAIRRGLWAQRASRLVFILLALGFVGSAVWTYYDYVLVWGHDPDLLFTNFEAGRAAIGQYARTLPPETVVYISPEVPSHPSIVFNAGARPGMKGYNGRVCTVAPARTTASTVYIIVPDEDPHSLPWLYDVFPTGDIVVEGPLHYQKPYFLAYGVAANMQAEIRVAHLAEATWDKKIKLLGYELGAETFRPGDTIPLVLTMQALTEMETNYIVFTHLLGPTNPANGGPLWAQDDSEPCRTFYPTSVWAVGEMVQDTYMLTIPAEAPPGDYDLQMGFYTWPEITHLMVDGTGQPTYVFGHIVVQDAAP